MKPLIPFLGIVLFPVIWIAVVWIIGTFSGWRRLAHVCPGQVDIPAEKMISFQNLGFGRFTSYNNCVSFGVSDQGLYIRVMVLFRIGHPPIFIPWDNLVFEECKLWKMIPAVRINVVTAPDRVLYIRPALAEKLAAIAGDHWPGFQKV